MAKKKLKILHRWESPDGAWKVAIQERGNFIVWHKDEFTIKRIGSNLLDLKPCPGGPIYNNERLGCECVKSKGDS